MNSHSIVILGAGLAGLAAARRLRIASLEPGVFEARNHVGGRIASKTSRGFTFDQGPHVSFTRRAHIRELLAKAVRGEYLESEAKVLNRWRDHWLAHPVQCHLFGLPTELVESCILAFAEAFSRNLPGPYKSYEDWCVASLGSEICRHFITKYTRKYWTTEPNNMTADWVGARVYRPSLKEVIGGALRDVPATEHYITAFRYPRTGGFGSYLAAVHAGEEVHLGHELVEANLASKELRFANGKQKYYDGLITSIPMPELIRCDVSAPARVRVAAETLVATSVVLVDVGLKGAEGLPDSHWMYFYDDEISFARANLPHRMSPRNVPDGKRSVQVEIYSSRYAPMKIKEIETRAVDDLIGAGVIRSAKNVLFAESRTIAYANVLFDRNCKEARQTVLDYLDTRGVVSCGRYGEWAYYWTDDAIESGWRAAERAMQKAIRTPRQRRRTVKQGLGGSRKPPAHDIRRRAPENLPRKGPGSRQR